MTGSVQSPRTLLRVIHSISETEWGEEAPVLGRGYDHVPPECRWRFTYPDNDIETAMVEAVASFRGNVGWSMWQSGRNWVITPRRIDDLMNKDEPSLRELNLRLSREDPEFGKAANADVERLGQHILAELGQRGLLD